MDEASVRRGLQGSAVAEGYRRIMGGLDPWPTERPSAVTVEEGPEGTFVRSIRDGARLLKIPPYEPELRELGRAVRMAARILSK